MKINHRLGFLIVVMFWMICQSAGATVLRENQREDQPLPLWDDVEVFRDSTGTLSIEKIASAGGEIKFIPPDVRHLQENSNDVFWIRFSLQGELNSSSEWAIQAFPSWLDDVRLYSQEANGEFSVNQMGDRFPFKAQVNRISVLAFPVTVESSPKTYYLRVKTHGPTILDLKAWKRSGLEKKEISRLLIFSAFAGAVGIMALMNLVFWGWVRKLIYPIYSLFLLVTLLGIASLQGYAVSFLFLNHPIWADRFNDVVVCMLISTGAIFTCHVFEYRRHSVWAAGLMYSVAIFFIAMIPLLIWGSPGNIIHSMIYLEIIVAIFNTMFVAWIIFFESHTNTFLPFSPFLA